MRLTTTSCYTIGVDHRRTGFTPGQLFAATRRTNLRELFPVRFDRDRRKFRFVFRMRLPIGRRRQVFAPAIGQLDVPFHAAVRRYQLAVVCFIIIYFTFQTLFTLVQYSKSEQIIFISVKTEGFKLDPIRVRLRRKPLIGF